MTTSNDALIEQLAQDLVPVRVFSTIKIALGTVAALVAMTALTVMAFGVDRSWSQGATTLPDAASALAWSALAMLTAKSFVPGGLRRSGWVFAAVVVLQVAASLPTGAAAAASAQSPLIRLLAVSALAVGPWVVLLTIASRCAPANALIASTLINVTAVLTGRLTARLCMPALTPTAALMVDIACILLAVMAVPLTRSLLVRLCPSLASRP